MEDLSNYCIFNYGARTSRGKYIHFALMYMTHHMFLVLLIKHLVKQDGETNMPHKLETITKNSVSNICVLFCPCVVQKETAQVDGKLLNMCYQSQTFF